MKSKLSFSSLRKRSNSSPTNEAQAQSSTQGDSSSTPPPAPGSHEPYQSLISTPPLNESHLELSNNVPVSSQNDGTNQLSPHFQRSDFMPMQMQADDLSSIASSSASTTQSSIFSRARSTGTSSTGLSSRYSAKGLGTIAEENGKTASTTNPVPLMRVVESTQYTPAEEKISSQNKKAQPKEKGKQRRPTSMLKHPYDGPSVMPEVPHENNLSNAPPLSLKTSRSIHSRFSPSSRPTHDFQSSCQSSQDYVSYSSAHPALPSSQLTLSNELKRLSENLLAQFEQASNGIASVNFIAGNVSNLLANCLASPPLQSVEPATISLHSEPALLLIIKVVLHFSDNLLKQESSRQRAVLLHKLYSLGVRLKLLASAPVNSTHILQNFAVGSIPELPCEKQVVQMVEAAATYSSEYTSDQQGAFIAPILRGFAPEFSVMSLIFGYPDLRPEHFERISSLCELRPDVHVLCQKNYIRACAGGSFKAPFRVPEDPLAPPISMSLSKKGSPTVSGTLGGYIYPQIDPENEELAQYAKSTFAVTCAHVCLDSGDNTGAPISVPSTFLANLYRKALSKECDKFPSGTMEHKTYASAVDEVDSKYANASSPEFGEVVWGERNVIGKHLSDVAIIKCNDNLKCKNYLGDDIQFSEYDPALMFGNLYVKTVIEKPRPGMEVFKYGSTTKYTSGQLSGPRMVYWSDGRLQSSEFVVSSGSPAFASGGDSGAWILHKNVEEEYGGSVNGSGSYPSTLRRPGPSLGVVGMLHSYDGERREFGLYTPICRLLDRLEEVTTIKWGVVGIADNHQVDSLAGGSDSSEDDERDASSDGE